MKEIFERLGFTESTRDGQTLKTLTMSNLVDYPGVVVFLHYENGEEQYHLSSGDLKFFGSIVFPKMSIKRSVEDIIKQLQVASYYHRLAEKYPPW